MVLQCYSGHLISTVYILSDNLSKFIKWKNKTITSNRIL